MSHLSETLELIRKGWMILPERPIKKIAGSRAITIPEAKPGDKIIPIIIPAYEGKYKHLESIRYWKCQHCMSLHPKQMKQCPQKTTQKNQKTIEKP